MIVRSLGTFNFRTQSLGYARCFRRYSSLQKTPDPLRILFCGADSFSCASLRALYLEHRRDPLSIASIDVVCRPPKPVGRGYKSIKELPISTQAKQLSLPLHEIDTFTGWSPPLHQGHRVNLIIAVSFGLLVPPRILNGARYGGLNVHPSMLPDFYGPAPLHHVLLKTCSLTGVTLQTMDPHHFDQGVILDQTPMPGLVYQSSTVSELSKEMAPFGAEMLVQAIRKRSFEAPWEVKGWKQTGHEGLVRHAPKITPNDRRIDWQTWTASRILHTQNVLGPLWNFVKKHPEGFSRSRRVIWSGGFFTTGESEIQQSSHEPGIPYSTALPHEKPVIYVNTSDGKVFRIERLKLDGGVEKESHRLLLTLGFDKSRKHNESNESQKESQVLCFV